MFMLLSWIQAIDQYYKTFLFVTYTPGDKLECLSLANLFILAYYLRQRPIFEAVDHAPKTPWWQTLSLTCAEHSNEEKKFYKTAFTLEKLRRENPHNSDTRASMGN
jgi:hypothetical protein